MINRLVILTLLFAAVVSQINAQEMDATIQKGNELYQQKQYPQAEAAYNEVLAKEPSNTTAKFNRADALYRQGKQGEAIKVLNDLAFKTDDHALKAKAYYNKGVILSAQKRLEESIDAYKDALRNDPTDQQARENLQKALLELKKKDPPKKEDDKKQQQQQKKQPQPQPKMNQKEAQQRLKLLEQKEKDVQERLQKEKSKQGGGQGKDW